MLMDFVCKFSMQLYFIGEEHLAVLTVAQPLAEVEANMDVLQRCAIANHSCDPNKAL